MTTEKNEKNEQPEDHEADIELDPKTTKEVRKILKGHLEGLTMVAHSMQEMNRASRKWYERQLGKLENTILELKNEVKRLKGSEKK